MQTLHWSDIGYHCLITRDGKVHKGRANGEVGAHCKGDNATSIGVCCVGKGDALPVGEGLPAGREAGYMNQAMWDALLRLVRQLVSAYGIPVSRVVGHRERPSGREQGKTCPGFDVAVIRNLLRGDVWRCQKDENPARRGNLTALLTDPCAILEPPELPPNSGTSCAKLSGTCSGRMPNYSVQRTTRGRVAPGQGVRMLAAFRRRSAQTSPSGPPRCLGAQRSRPALPRHHRKY